MPHRTWPVQPGTVNAPSDRWGDTYIGYALQLTEHLLRDYFDPVIANQSRIIATGNQTLATAQDIQTVVNSLSLGTGGGGATAQDILDTIGEHHEVWAAAHEVLQLELETTLGTMRDSLAGVTRHQTERVLTALKEISGGAPVETTQAIDRLGVVLETALLPPPGFTNVPGSIHGVGKTLLEIGAVAEQQIGPGMVVAANALHAIRETLAGTAVSGDAISALSAAAVDGLPRSADALGALASGLMTLSPAEEQALAQFEAGLSPLTLARFKPIWRVIQTTGQVALGMFGVEIANQVAERFPLVADVAQRAAHSMLNTYMGNLVGLTGIATSAFEGAAGGVLDVMQAQLDGAGELTAENAAAVIPRLVAHAMGMGLAAHMQSIISENIHGAKHLGFSQLAGFLAQFSGFGELARLVHGAQISAGLGQAMTRRANLVHRARLPDGRAAEAMFLEGRISPAKFARYLAEQGWADEWIEAHLQAVYREASPRDIAATFEDGPMDLEWASRHLRESGFTEEDALRIADGIRAKSLRSNRNAYLGEAVASYVEGLIPEGHLADALRVLDVDPAMIELTVGAAEFRRHRLAATAARRELEDSAALGQITTGDLAASLAGLGYDDFAQKQAEFRAGLRFSQKVFREEDARIKQEIREGQRAGVSAAVEQHRRGLIADDRLGALLVALGVGKTEADFMVQLALARRVPIPEPPRIVSEARQRQLVAEELAAGVETLQLAGLVDQSSAAQMMKAAGILPAIADARAMATARRVQARAHLLSQQTAEERAEEAQRAQTRAAVEQFRAGLMTSAGLRSALLATGNSPAVADAIVNVEVLRRTEEQAAAFAAAANAAAIQERRAEEQAAIAAFRAGRIDAAALFEILQAVGVPIGTADAIVRREVDLLAAG